MNKTRGGKRLPSVGWWIFVGLAFVTAVEYAIAIVLSINVFFLAQIAVLKAGLIIVYFMHIGRAWERGEKNED